LLFSDVSPPFSTTSATGSTAIQGTSFSGLVSFTGGDFALDGATITNIDGGNITTGSISGGSIPDANAPPSGSEEGTHIDLSNGKMVIGDADEYLWYDGTKLVLQGELINLAKQYFDGLAGAWQIVQDDVADLSGHQAFAEGAGLYRIIMVGGGGGAGSGSRVNSAASGGGASGIAFFTLNWDGTTAIANTHGDAGASTGTNSSGVTASAGGAATFSVGGSVRVTVNGGGGGQNHSASNKTTLATGGAGGTAALTSAHASVSDTTFRSGGAGGNAKRNVNTNVVAACSGGGGVDFFGNGDTHAGNATQNSSNNSTGSQAASGGGGPFGPSADVVVVTGNGASTGAVNQSAGQVRIGNQNTAFEPQIGSNILGPYLGSVAHGTSTAFSINTNAGTYFATGGGLCGGGGLARTNRNNNSIAAGSGGSGVLFGGGGGAAHNRAGVSTGGTGGIGAGGGAGSSPGNGGDGALFVLKL
jgi:hypothetical protein